MFVASTIYRGNTRNLNVRHWEQQIRLCVTRFKLPYPSILVSALGKQRLANGLVRDSFQQPYIPNREQHVDVG